MQPIIRWPVPFSEGRIVPMRIAPKVAVTDEQRETLERWSRGRTTPARLVRRAKMVMRAAEGKQNIEIADELGVERTVVARWRKRFADHGRAGIEKDAPRGGRRPNQAMARKILQYTTPRKPQTPPHW